MVKVTLYRFQPYNSQTDKIGTSRRWEEDDGRLLIRWSTVRLFDSVTPHLELTACEYPAKYWHISGSLLLQGP
jgi:hypothetical protein